MKWLTVAGLLASVTVLAVACAATQTSGTPSASRRQGAAPAHPRIKYSLKQSGEGPFGPSTLLATFNGKTSVLIGKSKGKCLQIVEQKDFDGEGSLNALVEDMTACGGNCCPNQFFFVSALPDGTFAMSDEFADSWKDPVIEKWKGRWSVVVVSNNEGVNRERPVEFTRRFVLEQGKAIKVEEHQRKDMKAIVEMRSEIFSGNNDRETHALQYDLDGDGKKDTITGKLWERWGRILWTVRFANGKEFSSNDGCKRIGVLSTKTNGVNDLVCDQDTVLHWNGSEYRE